MKKTISQLSIMALLIMLLVGCAGKGNEANKKTEEASGITILHTNDVHGYDSATDLFTGEPTETVIGHDTIAGVYDSFKENEEPVFLLDAGDAIQGIYFVTENEGEAAIEIMNEVGYDAMTLGNHEFDYGWFRLMDLIGKADFPILSQLDDEQTKETKNLQQYTVIEREGVKLGVFGITTPETQFKSDGGFGRDFGNVDSLTTYAKDMVKTLRDEEKVDYVVCLAHLGIEDSGYGTSYDIRDNVEGIDLIIDGHSHALLEDIENVEGKTQITSTGSYGEHIGVAKLTKTDDKAAVDLELMDAAACKDIEPREQVTKLISKWNETVAEVGNTVVGQIPFDITVTRENERTQETVMGNILTDAMREVSGADVAMQNGGSIRDQQLTTGDVTTAQILTILPYGNVLQMAEVKGEVIRECLEQGVSMYPEENGGFLQVSGMRYFFDPSLPKGQRVKEIYIGEEELDPEKYYKLCTNDFIAMGGDEFTMLVEPFSSQMQLKMPEYTAIENALIWYIEGHQGALSDQVEGRIIKE